MANRKEFKVAYSDGADHAGVATFARERDAQDFVKALNTTGDYVVCYVDRSRMVRASQRRSWFFDQEDTFEG
jgi:hypothetical protein